MSHHLDSPLAREDPRLDISDVYVFKGATGTAFVINVNPQSGDGGFHHEAMYEFKVDLSGDAREDITFRATFGERMDGKQSVKLRQLTGADATDRMADGEVVANGETDQVIMSENGVKLFAGSAGEPFYIPGPVVGAMKEAIAHGEALDLGDFDPAHAENLFGNTNVSTIVLEISDDMLDADEIGFWGTVALATDAGGWRQVQRAAHPLVNTLYDFTEIDADYNATQPSEDEKNYGHFVRKKTAKVVKEMDTVQQPEKHGKEVADAFFPDVLRYKIGTEAQFSLLAPNGRGLRENTPEITFEFVLGTLVDTGLGPDAATGELRDEFPYLSLPISLQ
jgi:hypothetical protein